MISNKLKYSRWCEGLKSNGQRKLRPAEVEQLQLTTRAALFKIWMPIAIAIASPLALLASYLLHGDGAEPPPRLAIPVFALMALGSMILPAAALLVLRDTIKRWRLLRHDLNDSVVEQFMSERKQLTSENDSATPPAEEMVQNLELLPNSGIIFSINGVHQTHGTTVNVYESATPPDSAPLYAVSGEITADIPIDVREQAQIERRKLNVSELDELKQHIKRFRRPPVAMLIFLAWSGLAIIMGFVNRKNFYTWLQEYKIGIIAVVISTLWQLFQFVRMYISSRALEADQRTGWVLVVQGKDSQQEHYEYLPKSKAPWSVDGTPTEWRRKKASGSAN
jgi:hypothetical protein